MPGKKAGDGPGVFTGITLIPSFKRITDVFD